MKDEKILANFLIEIQVILDAAACCAVWEWENFSSALNICFSSL
jgi:hypothetical protein